MHPSRVSPRGFTLIELLTVIAIIGILAAIIIPTVGRVRASAQQAKCTSNLRQLGTATLMWYQDNPRGKLTPQLEQPNPYVTGQTWNVSWTAALLPYLNVKSPDQYPSQPDLTHCGATYPEGSWQKNSYGLNALTNDAQWPKGYNAITQPSRTLLAGDVVGTTLDPAATNAWQVLNPPGLAGGGSPSDPSSLALRHGGAKANVVFFDAHVELVDREKYEWTAVGGWGARAPENPWKIW